MADSDDGGSTLTITPGDRDAMIRTVLGEAGNQGEVGQAAVAHVIMNRAIGSGSSPTSVVMAPNQFEANANGLQNYAPSSPAYQSAARVVDGVLGGDVLDPTNGADHFLNPRSRRAMGASRSGREATRRRSGSTSSSAGAGRRRRRARPMRRPPSPRPSSLPRLPRKAASRPD